MVINTRQFLSKTLLKLALLTLAVQQLTAEGSDITTSPGLLDNRPLISIETVADPLENEIEDGTRSGRKLNVSETQLNSVFDDVYEKCLVNMSFPCLQRKMLVYMNKMDRIKGMNLISNIVSVVRTNDDRTPEITEEDLEKKLSPAEEETQLENLMEHQVDKFMDNHVIRLRLPEGITAGLSNSLKGRSYSIAGNALDISLARMFSIAEGRKKGGGGGGKKKKKKMMGMMMMMLMAKSAILMPKLLMLVKLKALKALIIAKIALALSLFQLIKKLMSSKGSSGGGGSMSNKEVIIVHDSHGDSGSSGGGWSSGGGSGGWSSGGSSGGHGGGGGGGGHGGGDSYSTGAHHGGGDSTYGGGDAGGGGGGGWSSGGSGGGWGKRSWDPYSNSHVTHTTWPLYKASAYAAALSNNADEAR